jgi:outer membrane receptor protein involved in Fe transport
VDVVVTGAFGGGGATAGGLGGGPGDVLVRWDGVPLNVADGAAELASLTLDGVEQIEVRSGAVADLAGAGAETMVVDVRTFAPASLRRAAIEAWSGPDATVLGRGELASGGRLGKAWAALSGLGSDGGLVAGESYSRWAFGSGLEVSDERTYLRGAIHRGTSRYGFPGADMGLPPPQTGSVATPDQAQNGAVTTVSLEAGTTLFERVGLSARLGRHTRTLRYRATYPDTVTGAVPLAEARHGRAFRTHYEVRAAFRLGGHAAGAIGLEQDNAETTEDDTIGYIGAPPPMGSLSTRSQWAQRRRTAVHLSVSAEIGSWRFAAGIRRDDPKWFPSAATWRALLAHDLGAGTRIHLGARTGFRGPTPADGPVVPALRNETSRTLEAGIEQELGGGRVRVSAAGLEQRFGDVIAPYPVAMTVGPPVLYALNAGAARARGWELEAALRPLRALSLTAAWSHLPVRVVSTAHPPWLGFQVGQPQMDRPSDLVVAGATLRLGRGGLVDVRLRSVSGRVWMSRFTLDLDTLPGYTVLDAGGRLPIAPWLQVTLRGENLLGEHYAERAGYVGRGRSLTAGVRLGTP